VLKRITIPPAFEAIRYRNFRLFLFGQIVSVTGSWMQTVAQSWLVFRLTHSSFLLGLVSFVGLFPVFVLSLAGGVAADRYPRRILVIITQSLQMVQAFILAYLTLRQIITVNEILYLALFSGIVMAFDIPARQSFMIEMVEADALPSAIAMNSSAFNGARIFGPALAGMILALTNEGICFLLNAFSFLAVVWALLVMDIKSRRHTDSRESPLAYLLGGVKYAYSYLPARALLALEALLSLLGMAYTVLMPVFADKLLHRGSSGLGILMMSVGSGALLGSIYVGMKKEIRGMGRIVAYACILFGVSSALFAYSKNFYLSNLLLMLTGFGMFAQLTTANILLQTLVPDELRGRLMSLYSLVVVGLTPFGSLLSGAMAQHWGSPFPVAFSGGFCALGGFAFWAWIPRIRAQVRETLAHPMLPEAP